MSIWWTNYWFSEIFRQSWLELEHSGDFSGTFCNLNRKNCNPQISKYLWLAIRFYLPSESNCTAHLSYKNVWGTRSFLETSYFIWSFRMDWNNFFTTSNLSPFLMLSSWEMLLAGTFSTQMKMINNTTKFLRPSIWRKGCQIETSQMSVRHIWCHDDAIRTFLAFSGDVIHSFLLPQHLPAFPSHSHGIVLGIQSPTGLVHTLQLLSHLFLIIGKYPKNDHRARKRAD